MLSKEIIEKRRELQKELRSVVNFSTGLYSKEKQEWDKKVEELQTLCKHAWDDGETAMEKAETYSFCAICGKKWR